MRQKESVPAYSFSLLRIAGVLVKTSMPSRDRIDAGCRNAARALYLYNAHPAGADLH